MESADQKYEVLTASEPRTPTRCAHPRPRSLTMIPYVDHSEKTAPSMPIPPPEDESPLIDLTTPKNKPAAELLEEAFDLAPLPPPPRTVSPFPSHPFVTNADKLRAAVSENPTRIFAAIQNLVNDRDGLRADLARTTAELRSVTENLASIKIDHKAAGDRYEELFRVGSAKQVILWKYVESLHAQLSAAKGIVHPNVGPGSSLVSDMNIRGGPGMGVAMEKWIGDGFDSDKASRVVEEGSEQGTEQSVWSADDSFSSKSLDPNALAFVPQSGSPQKLRGRSPVKRFQNSSPERILGRRLALSAPVTYNTSYAVQDPFQDQPRAPLQLQMMPPPVNIIKLLAPLDSLLVPMSRRWNGVCPFSLVSCQPCPLGYLCRLISLCKYYNNEDGNGCELFKKVGQAACRYPHEYRVCEDAVSEKPGVCVWEANILGKHPATMEQVKKKKERHLRIRVHKSTCEGLEWDARMLLLSMRDAHARGVFNGV